MDESTLKQDLLKLILEKAVVRGERKLASGKISQYYIDGKQVTLDAQGGARLVITPDQATFRRQDAPQVFDVTTVAYAARPAFVLASTGLFQGRVEAVVVPAERAIDIDTEFDFRMAECLLQQSGARS